MLVAALLTAVVSFSQKINNVEIVLNSSLATGAEELPYSNQPITWNEFKGDPDHGCSFAAMTYSGIKLKYNYKSSKGVVIARVELCPYMDLSRSWFKKDFCNDSTLEHEQRHFDITAIITKQFSDELKKRNFTVATFPAEIKNLHQNYLQKLAQMQQQYDGETVHGTLADKQAEWDKKIVSELRKALDKS